MNTFFGTAPDDVWTYQKGGRRRRIDFLCIDHNVANMTVDTGSCHDLMVGADHRAVQMTMRLQEHTDALSTREVE